MKLFNREVKENPVGAAYFMGNDKKWAPKKTRERIEEGYKQNVIVYRAIREIVTGIADIAIEVKRGDEILTNHPALELLNRPNPMQGGDSFVKQLFTDYLITGEMACVRYPDSGMPVELWPINPMDIEVKAGRKGMPSAYIHKVNNKEKSFPVDEMTGASQMFFMKMYDPTNYWRGMPPLQAAGLSADTHNEGMKWNYSLLRNGARPSGIIKFEGDPSGNTISRIKEFFKKQIQGSSNAGEIPVLTGGADWQSVDTSPRDMDYINTMREVTKYIAAAFGVPLPLIENDAASYNNIEQAKERLWTDTILPLFNEWLNQFGNWLMPMYGDNLELCANLDDIPALEGVRTRTFERMMNAVEKGVLTADEAREAIGYEPKGGMADSLFVNANQIPLDMADSNPEDEKMFDYLFEEKSNE